MNRQNKSWSGVTQSESGSIRCGKASITDKKGNERSEVLYIASIDIETNMDIGTILVVVDTIASSWRRSPIPCREKANQSLLWATTKSPN